MSDTNEHQLTIVKPGEGLTLKDQMNTFFDEFRTHAKAYKAEVDQLVIKDENDIDGMEKAREMRLAIRRKRLDVETLHKEKKADALKMGQTLDEIKREILSELEPLEADLQAKEDFAKLAEQKRKNDLFNERAELLKPYIGEDAKKIQLAELGQPAFDAMLNGYRLSFADKIRVEEEARKQREEQAVKDKAENDRRAELQLRINKLSSMKMVFNVQEQAYTYDTLVVKLVDLEAMEGSTFELKAGQLKKSIDAKIKKDEAEKKRIADEAEVNRKKLEKLEDDKKAKAAEARKLKRAPDKVKLDALALSFQEYSLPTVADDDSQKIIDGVRTMLTKMSDYITKHTATL